MGPGAWAGVNDAEKPSECGPGVIVIANASGVGSKPVRVAIPCPSQHTSAPQPPGNVLTLVIEKLASRPLLVPDHSDPGARKMLWGKPWSRQVMFPIGMFVPLPSAVQSPVKNAVPAPSPQHGRGPIEANPCPPRKGVIAESW